MSRRLAICLINPRSRPSYWTADFAMPFYGLGRKLKYSMANGALISVAALVPAGHDVVLIDENIEPIDFERLRRFDVIGVTGMVVQAPRMLEILQQLRGLPAIVAVGGPFVSVSEATFAGLCHVRFIGEAEQTWPAFLESVAAGLPFAEREEQFAFIQSSGIATLSISLLTPLPTTPLYDRLRAEGRLDFSDPELIYLPKQMTREQLKTGFRGLLNRVFEADAFFDRVFKGRAMAGARRSPSRPGTRFLARRFVFSTAWAARALMLVGVMAREGQLRKHLRACRRVWRRNSALGAEAFGFGELVGLWITYWHFASVTRQISGTQFGNVPSQ